uniref:Large ribosomal subunit protein uL22c n=1 Tax=Lysimachia europaea TaxID=59991 RepID=A0A8K1Z1A6_LYSEU|nr:ribosomal protein L22 [Trientalis europaea]BDY11305.1 ribosomal protein L22 [Trientalis europaea]
MIKKNKNKIYALGQHISMSAHKARRVIDQIRGRSYEETLMILELMPYRASYSIFKLVYSAAANASDNMGSDETNLIICKAEVNEGTTVKKLKPRARGRSYPIKRPTCHITIGVKDISLYEGEYFVDPYINKDYLTSLKKPRWKNTYTDMIDENVYSSEGLWDKK